MGFLNVNMTSSGDLGQRTRDWVGPWYLFYPPQTFCKDGELSICAGGSFCQLSVLHVARATLFITLFSCDQLFMCGFNTSL